MKKVIFAALVTTGLIAAASAQVDFTRAPDTKDFVSQAVAADLPVPAVAAPGRMTYSRDCARFSFGPADGEMLSQKVYLRSTEYETVCHTQMVQQCHTVMVPGPNNTQVPQQQCHMVPVQNCYERPGMTWGEYGQIKVNARQLLPWERENFEICLQGPWMDLYVNAAAYKYTAKREGGNYETLFVLTPGQKVAMKADEDGINYADFAFVDGKFVFKASDKWAKEYAGEKVAIKVELYKDNALFFDTFKGSKEFTFDAAEGYTMAFTEGDLEKPEADANDGIRGAKKYFLKWGFKRVGSLSKDNFVKKDKTPVISK
ncbi:MAG: hypothetical protein PHV33_13385 [Elusimicrobiales bacterium]|nr:hypothetical protein [Elusimicrobiales bacterium]